MFRIFIIINIVIALSGSNHLYSQKYGAAWIVGYSNDSTYYPKYGKTEINFSTGVINVKYKFGEILPDLDFTNASIANMDGTLRYFTDGYRIYDGKQKVIKNGDSISYGRIWRDFKGGWPAEYNNYFLPMPGKENTSTLLINFQPKYHPDQVHRFIYYPEFKYSMIEYNSVIQSDIVIIKDSIITYGDFVKPHMAMTKHANGRDWWIITEDYLTNNHNIYLLDTSGIRLFARQRIGLPADSIDWTGNSTFTPNGEKFIKYLRESQIQIFDFDRCNGIISNPQVVINEKARDKDYCYVAVSPNNRFLYFNCDSIIWQYDLFANDIKGSETIVGEWDGYYFDNRLTTSFNQISLAEDGKIYVSCRSSSIYLHVINNPNEKGADCNFQLRQVELPAFMFGNLPAPPNYRLGSLQGTVCDTLFSGTDDIVDSFIIYPNPVSDYFEVKSSTAKDFRVRLLNPVGQIVRDYSGSYPCVFDVSNIPSGLYIIQIELKHRQFLKRIIII
ncbi:MAG TPA: T9SS type A sorting domain-containing protein [Saprospiraceae bacterium]|nr:T9SS type A sorting domain-containing protein [Saprospiraceae bacterium]HMX87329.1 T9SS type A sorting domain-containing protein [Saprospiraceae bacterium]HMZ39156.1 T9SS type A sorting domain-containing protein [Saprospiraceae bacterium]HNA63817.1 T9SS type A sorting domain-containing protein [Saprospiraceae bacterium]HNB29852.1 T9SS type A sorting domain-containing protein [Saprospiraceae bacterium]